MKKIIVLLLTLLMTLSMLTGCASLFVPLPMENDDGYSFTESYTQEVTLDENGSYYSKEDVALYIHTYGKLPSNFITKDEARALGWEGGSVERYAPGKAIGGDRFGNREGLLPKADGRYYTECDINTLGKDSRGAERIVFSNDGLIYYTADHYERFTLLYDANGEVVAS